MKRKTENITVAELLRLVDSGARPKIVLEADEELPEEEGVVTCCHASDDDPEVWIYALVGDATDGEESEVCLAKDAVVRRILED